MKCLIGLLLTTLILCGVALSQSADRGDWVITEKAWGEVKIGQSVDEVNAILGAPTSFGPPGKDMIFADYGLTEVSFTYRAETQILRAICFHGEQTPKSISVFRMKGGIDWDSAEDEVVKAFGKPIKTISEASRRRLIYDTMLFLFNGHQLIGACVTDGKEDFFLR